MWSPTATSSQRCKRTARALTTHRCIFSAALSIPHRYWNGFGSFVFACRGVGGVASHLCVRVIRRFAKPSTLPTAWRAHVFSKRRYMARTASRPSCSPRCAAFPWPTPAPSMRRWGARSLPCRCTSCGVPRMCLCQPPPRRAFRSSCGHGFCAGRSFERVVCSVSLSPSLTHTYASAHTDPCRSQQLLPNSKLRLFPNRGHIFLLELPEQVCDACVALLGARRRRRPRAVCVQVANEVSAFLCDAEERASRSSASQR